MIRVREIHKRFGTLQVLRGASLGVDRGDVAVLIGASGSGKSTLLRCVNGLESFDAGEVEVDGNRLGPNDFDRSNHLLPQLRRRVGMVFQQFNLFPHMTAMQNVMAGPLYALNLHKSEAEQRARRQLDRVGLSDKLHARPSTLSGGQQQRVAIARALANEPAVMLFDEPTSALDPKMTAEVLAVMADLASSGQTMLVVSHAMGFVRRSAKHVHVFADGVVVESGPPEQILSDARHPRTRELLASSAEN
jgi:ABC-type polar amino acid transport system ATPase subunit